MKRALISLSDKRGVIEFAKGLAELGFEILSTGGTAKLLRDQGLKVVEVGDYTGQREIMDGRLKTLHPKIHGGILAMRSNPGHMREIRESGIEPIDVIAVNLYPFEETVQKQMRGIGGRAVSPPDSSAGSGLASPALMEAIENIDIGGPTMIRAAAKNWQDVAVVVDPGDYPVVLAELKKNGGEVSKETKFRLAAKVFVLTSRYDGAIANYLTGGKDAAFPEAFNYQGRKIQELRYGENPHQKAAFYLDASGPGGEPSIATSRQLHGKELSYNNIMDLDAALEAVKEFSEPAVVIIKHATPCGVAQGGGGQGLPLRDVFVNARDCDPTSAFGGIIAVNARIDARTAAEIGKDFYECVVAPSYDPEALDVLKGKKNIRLMELPGWEEWLRPGPHARSSVPALRKVTGGLLVQERDLFQCDVRKAKVATKRAPTEAEWLAMEFAWKVAKHVKSNAIVYATSDRTIGIGGGQVSRVDATKIGLSKARVPVSGAVMASDAFFPFRDNVDEAAKAGIRAVIQPGGSVKDAEVIQACDEQGLAMVFTAARHFRH